MSRFKKSLRLGATSTVLVFLLLTFQNCSPGFSVKEEGRLSSSQSSGGVTSSDSGVGPSETREYLPGVNIAGAEINLGKSGARLFYDYIYPTRQEIEYFSAKGFKIIRIPFDIDRMQPRRQGPLNETELALLDEVVQVALAKNLKVLLDPHNFGSFKDSSGVNRVVGVDSQLPAVMLSDFWSRMAQVYKDSESVYFGLMNEPHDHSATQWKAVAVESVKAIRATGAKNKIMIPGTAWTGAHSWISSGNAAAWKGFSDINFAFEVHQYLDSDSSGTHAECIEGAAEAVKDVTAWAAENNYELFLGEIGWSSSSLCQSEAQKLMSYLRAHSHVWLGYSYWTSGPWYGDYMFTLEPRGLGTAEVIDRPQMSVLLSNL